MEEREPPAKRRKIEETCPADLETLETKEFIKVECTTVSSPKRPPSTPRRATSRRRLPFWPDRVTPEILASVPNLEWIVSHVDPNAIIWSSHPDVLPPDLTHTSGISQKEQDCANTWFVEHPTPSLHSIPESHESSLAKAAEAIRTADGLLIVAGAGIGVDSGLPDYRGPAGFWTEYRGLQHMGLSLEEISHPDWFQTDPEAAWGLYGSRMNLYLNANPHRGFQILLAIARQKRNNYFVFTSNIDGQFSKGGFDEKKLFESHGTLAWFALVLLTPLAISLLTSEYRMQCVSETCPHVWRSKQLPTIKTAVVSSEDAFTIPVALKGSLPKCPKCGQLARPNVSMFGDDSTSWKSSRAEEQKKRMMKFLSSYQGSPSAKSLVIFEIGCGTSLHSLRCDVELLLQQIPSAHLIRINPVASQVHSGAAVDSHDAVRIGLPMGALDALVGIAQKLEISTSRPSRHVSRFKLKVSDHDEFI